MVLPMAGSNAGVVFDVGLNQASAGANFERGAVNTAENFGRNENENGHCGGKGNKDNKDNKDNPGDNCKCDNGDKGDHGQDCEKGPSKPH